jgi:hypothetical protein
MMSNQNTNLVISADALLPDIVSQYPSTRAVFDRYGLHGCGGQLGPREPVAWFARLYGVSLDKLLDELREATNEPASVAVESSPSIADTIYRPFFLAGIVTVLTLGCMWGAINLLTIGLKENFSGVNYSWVLAHAHAMVFGFVGFFIMGFAYQAFPRFKHTNLWRPRLAFSALPLMIAGILLQTIAHLLSPPSLSLEIMAATIQLTSVIIFSTAIIMTARLAQKRESYDRFVYAALGWFLLAAIANPVIFKLFELPGSRQELLFNLATFNIPYRDVQLLGIAVVMILGVSLRLLPHAYGLRGSSRRTPNTKVGDVLACYPQSLEIFVRRGFTPLRNPVLRKTMARAITIEQACRREGVDLDDLLRELRQIADNNRGSSSPLVSITRIEQAQGV